jgi:hypothetical protein
MYKNIKIYFTCVKTNKINNVRKLVNILILIYIIQIKLN